MISHSVSSSGKNWNEIVPFALIAYRRAPHVATGFSPHMLLFGQEMKLTEADNPVLESEIDDTQFEIHHLVEKLRRVIEIAIYNS